MSRKPRPNVEHTAAANVIPGEVQARNFNTDGGNTDGLKNLGECCRSC